MKLAQLASATGGLLQPADIADRDVTQITADSRQVREGALFIALPGEHVDGHDFCASAVEAGACAVMVEKSMPGLPVLRVTNTRLATGAAATAWLKQFAVKKVGLTGSSGKTTCKEMLALALACHAPTLVTAGNQNNDLGVPFTAFRLQPEHHFAVFEIGTNSPGEITVLSQIVKPDVALLLNVQLAHLGGFGSVEALANEKMSIFDGLAKDGVAILPGDDMRSENWVAQLKANGFTPGQIVLVYASEDATLPVWAHGCRYVCLLSDTVTQGQRAIQFLCDGEEFTVPVAFLSTHNVRNFLFAMAAVSALRMDIAPSAVAAGAFMEPRGRGGLVELGSLRIIDDSYNANPDSMCAAIRRLKTMSGRRVAMLGCMAELGEKSAVMHEALGQEIARSGIDVAWIAGPEAAYVARGCEGASMVVRIFDDTNAMMAAAGNEIWSGATILLKGSRRYGMERLIPVLGGTKDAVIAN